jgi:ubiquinone/menaquinone biosynthesis C-methylase UbiE
MTYMTRKRFLGSLTAISATASIASWSKMAGGEEPLSTTTTDQPSSDKASRFADRVFEDSARMLCGALSYMGDRLGLFKSMSLIGQCTPVQLAQASKCNERLIAEWLKAMMAYGYVEYLPDSGRFYLSPEKGAVLADETSPMFMGGMLQTTVPQVMVAHEVMEAFTSGKPMTPDVFHPDLWEGIDRSSAGIYQHQLVDQWLSLMPGVIDSLKAGGHAVDVGCGQGNAVIVLARRFPNSRFVGFDPYGPSVEKAKRAARRAGVSDRTDFIVGSAEDLPSGQFDLATSFLTLHHMSHPVRDLAAICESLTATGSYLIREDNLSNELQGHVTPLARLSYSASVLCCLHDSMANDGAALGPLTEARTTRLAKRAGFSKFRKLPFESAYEALYEAKR